MNRILALALPLSLAVLGCEGSLSRRTPVPFFFAKQVDSAEKDFDHNLFLSFRKDGLLAAPVTLANETQLSLSPPLPSRLTFTVDVPPEPVLQFSIGVSTLGEEVLANHVDFAISIEYDGEKRVCFKETVRRRQPNTWLDQTVDLGPWSGKTVRLTFETSVRQKSRADSGTSFLPVWGSPVLDSSLGRSEGPNLVLISIDCLRADHVSAYGYNRNTTPSIDRFAAEAVLFENAVSVSSWTLPTHMTMLTGLMPSLHGASRSHKLSNSVSFLPEILSQAGYQTLGVVSGAYLSQAFGFERGFDIYRVLNGSRATEVVDVALDLVIGARTRDQFLLLHLFDAHWPYLPPREFRDRFAERPADISRMMHKPVQRVPPSDPEEIAQFIDLYNAEVAYLDQELGRFFEGLREAELYDRSLIVLTADHGESFYEHGLWQHADSLYEEVTHVPLIVKWPGESPSGKVDGLVSQLHIFPTILEQAGLDSPYADYGALDRYVAGEQLVGERDPIMSEITWEPKENRGAAMKISLRNGALKYIVSLAGEVGDEQFVLRVKEEELYDLSRDPGERNNLVPDASRNIGEMRHEARQFIDKARMLRASRRGQEIVLDDALREELKALGYIN